MTIFGVIGAFVGLTTLTAVMMHIAFYCVELIEVVGEITDEMIMNAYIAVHCGSGYSGRLFEDQDDDSVGFIIYNSDGDPVSSATFDRFKGIVRYAHELIEF